MYELYVKQKIEEGLADIEAGRTVSHEEVKAELLGHADYV
jgi:predicted transcriptional regulator